MRINTAKRLLLAGEPVVGPLLSLGAPLIVELLSQAGFDYVIIDTQHGAWDDASTMQAFRSVALGSAVPMVRVRTNDFYAIGRLLDQGALGIIVPLVNTVEEARAAAEAVRYPPRGERSFGPFAAGFHAPDYLHWIDDEVFLAVQIETEEALDAAEAILSVEGVDGCWVGPWDLGRSMGIDLTEPDCWEALEPAMERILTACRNTNTVPGVYAVGQGPHRLAQGFKFVTVCSDTQFITEGALRMLHDLGRPDTTQGLEPYEA